MKHIFKVLILTILVTACGGENQSASIEDILASGDSKTMQTKKDALEKQQQTLADQIKQLSDSIKALNPDKNIPLITTFTTQAKKFEHYLELQGSVETKQNLVVTPEANGILNYVYVKEGDRVSKGQIIAKIDDGGMAQQRAQLQIQVDLAKTTYERQKRLWDQKIGSEIDFLSSKTNYEALQESVNQIDKQLSKTNVRAPFSGVIDDVITEQGNVVAAGQSRIVRLVNLNNMYVATDVPETYITSITKGKSVEIFFPVLGKTINGTVRQTSNFINPANRTFKVEVAVPNKDKTIKPNLTARLKINDYTNDEGILIPQSIISENAAGEQYVYVLKDKSADKATAEQVIITTGKTQGDHIEVLKGITANTELIEEGARSVKNNQSVKIKKSLDN